MWQFGVGMFLVTIDPTSLRLTATYGFVSGVAILFLGAILGNWIDKHPRLPGKKIKYNNNLAIV